MENFSAHITEFKKKKESTQNGLRDTKNLNDCIK